MGPNPGLLDGGAEPSALAEGLEARFGGLTPQAIITHGKPTASASSESKRPESGNATVKAIANNAITRD